MNLVFVHHANRKRGNPSTQQDGITSLGKRDAKLTAEVLKLASKELRFTTIYTSTFTRCTKTAKILNDKLKVTIVEDKRLNEFRSMGLETWTECQKRVIDCLKDIVKEHGEDESVIVITSGTNLVGFMDFAYNLEPTENSPFFRIPSCSPIIFRLGEKPKEK